MTDRFGIASLRATEGPRRLSDFGLTSSASRWVATYLLTEPTNDDAAVFAAGLLYGGHADYAREPGALGELTAYADTVDPDDDRLLTVDDLVGFEREE